MAVKLILSLQLILNYQLLLQFGFAMISPVTVILFVKVKELMDNQEQKHQRRVRYKGTHPKKFNEKYKELQPEKYADAVAKVIQKGNTPAGMHRSICVQEILEILQITPGQIGLDATLGYGGHTLEMLKCLDTKGHLYSLDVDPIELPRT